MGVQLVASRVGLKQSLPMHDALQIIIFASLADNSAGEPGLKVQEWRKPIM
jgi:hypothetical protein